jgi:hypothetical protein
MIADLEIKMREIRHGSKIKGDTNINLLNQTLTQNSITWKDFQLAIDNEKGSEDAQHPNRKKVVFGKHGIDEL